jgi:hypothetical protein
MRINKFFEDSDKKDIIAILYLLYNYCLYILLYLYLGHKFTNAEFYLLFFSSLSILFN